MWSSKISNFFFCSSVEPDRGDALQYSDVTVGGSRAAGSGYQTDIQPTKRLGFLMGENTKPDHPPSRLKTKTSHRNKTK